MENKEKIKLADVPRKQWIKVGIVLALYLLFLYG